MDEQTKLQYFPQAERDEHLKDIMNQYKRDIVALEISLRLLNNGLAINKMVDKKNKKLGKHEIDIIEEQIVKHQNQITHSYEAIRVIADIVLEDMGKTPEVEEETNNS